MQIKKIDFAGLVLRNTVLDGVRYGDDDRRMNMLPRTYKGRTLQKDELIEHYDSPAPALGGTWDTDPRLIITARAPYPATVQAVVLNIDTRDRP